jgi:hypothetical protein
VLAGLGAEVLRVDPPSWDEPGVVPEMTLGKRCARPDARAPKFRFVLHELLRQDGRAVCRPADGDDRFFVLAMSPFVWRGRDSYG